MYQKWIKRALDILVCLPALTVLAIPMLIIALIIKLDSPGPVFFRQKRVGLNKSYFSIYKFRTMRSDTPHDMPTHLLQSSQSYITRVGAFLRKSSLDELPQLINILKGDMSLVGPRPALWNQDDLIAARDRVNANSVRPGLTGLAQIQGRDELAIEEKARWDGRYVQSVSFAADLKILLGTVSAVVSARGYQEGAAKK